MIKMTSSEKAELANEKAKWRHQMRKTFGSTWTKRTSSLVHSNGMRRMNNSPLRPTG